MGRLWATSAGALCCLLFPVLPILAADPQMPAPPPPHWLVFSGIDGSVRAATGWIGADYAAADLDSDGVRLRGVTGYGRYRTGAADASRVDVDKSFATTLLGRAWATPLWRASVFAGGELDARTPNTAAAPSGDRGTRVGAAVSAELWATPAPGLELTASTGFGTARSSWALRASVCHRLGAVCLGPDAAATGDPAGSELRLGVAVAGLSLGALELRLAGGVARKNDADSGGYGFVTVWQRF